LTIVVLLMTMESQPFARVDAGEPALRMLVAGAGSPTVVFDTGASNALELWGEVPVEVSKFTRVVAYDRAGNGLSEKASTPLGFRKTFQCFSSMRAD
jgi:pimeloyl-ACP methyl ester carboxylesterase